MRIKFILNFSHCTILTNLFTFAEKKRLLILRQTDTYRKSKSENNGSVAHPDSYREYSEAENGSVAQLYSASDFGSEGWGLESLRGHKNWGLVQKAFDTLRGH